MPWRFEFDGEVYLEGDLTVGQCEDISDMVGKDWLFIHPLKSAKEASAILAVLMAARSGRTVDEHRAEIRAMKADDYIDALKITADEGDTPTEYVDGNPQPADEPSTPT